MINNVVALAKSAKIFNVPTLLTSVVQDPGGASATNLAWELQLLNSRPGVGT
jgi:hypothetical protein